MSIDVGIMMNVRNDLINMIKQQNLLLFVFLSFD